MTPIHSGVKRRSHSISGGLLRHSPQVKYGFIREHKQEFSISAMCRTLEVSVSGYYRFCTRSKSQREQENDSLLGKIKALHKESHNRYGSRKIYRKLSQSGEGCKHERVERLMRERGIRAKRVKKYKATTNSRHNKPVAENVLSHGFKVSEPDKVWVSDITGRL